MDFKALLVLACFAANTLAVPTTRESQCASRCESREDEGMFRAFKSYFFDYEVTIDSRIDGGASDQTSRVRIEATAAIEGLAPCEMVLKLSQVGITEMREDGTMVAAATARDFVASMEEHPLRFSMESNGTITSVCPEAGEELWVLNAKRGFLSAIQTKRTRPEEAMGQVGIFETDVTGTCMPMYQGEGGVTTKTQDYLMCKNRTNLNMFVDAIPVHLLAPTASPMKSRLECRYESDSQSLTSVTCNEEHTLKPFAQSDSKPLTSVVTRITRKSITHRITSSLSGEFERRTTLLFEDPAMVNVVSRRTVMNKLNEICDSLAVGVGSETPGLFEQLAGQLSGLNMDDMNTVITRLFRICPDATPSTKKDVINMVKDALTDCNTEECAQGFHTIMQTENSADNDLYLRKWFMKLAFHKNPTKNMINIMKRHVRGSEEVNAPAYYALSNMINRYCVLAESDCRRDNDILAAAATFEQNLHDACLPETDEDIKKMMISLRAIGNMGVVQSRALLNRCNRDQNAIKLRIASIEAFRRVPCNSVPTERFMRIFGSTEVDSELRIAAYRAIIRCPSDILLQGIQDVLAREPTHQVSCYVSSHLTNVRDTNNPLLRNLQTTIKESALTNTTQCNMDIRKFSRNYAFSRYDEESGNGINVDGDVIFSSKSYLPRSVRLGMDIDIFGYEFDLFEIDARMDGLQELFESAFEQDSNERESNMLRGMGRLLKHRVYRQKREGVKTSSLNRIKNKYMDNHVLSEDSEEGALSMKIFDNEVFYKDQDDFTAFAGKFSRENIMMLVASLTQQRTHEYTLNKEFKPSMATIPTMAGFPLQVSIQGAMTTAIKASGKIDMMGMATKPRSMSVLGSIEPSAAVEVQSTMAVDAHCARSGLTHKTNMASSLSMGGSITIDQGTLKVKMDAPERRQTIINATSTLFFMQNNELVPVAEPADAINTVDETLNSTLFNLHIGGSRPSAPLSLPDSLYHNWRMQIYFDKIDESLTTFDLEAGYRMDKEYRNGAIQKTDRVHLLVGARGSESIGTYATDLTYHRSNTTLVIHTATPLFDTHMTASLRNETYHKNLMLHMVHNGRDYLIQAGLDTIRLANNGVKYVPVFNLTVAEFESYALEGNVTLTEESKEIDLSLLNGNKDALVALKGDFIQSTNMRRLSLSQTLGPFTSSLKAGYEFESTPDSTSITPIFSITTSIPAVMSFRLDGAPIVKTATGLSAKELYLTTPYTRLIEMSNFHIEKSPAICFGFEGKIKETVPFGVSFEQSTSEVNNVVEHSVNLTATTIFGDYHISGSLRNETAENIYGLRVNTEVNGTQYFSVQTILKNEAGVQQYLDAFFSYGGREILRSKTGLRQRRTNSKTKYTPIFVLEMPSSLGSLKTKGSCDVTENGIVLKDMGLVGSEDLFILSGNANLDKDIRRVDWALNVGGAYVTSSVEGAASHFENTVTFNNVITRQEGSETPPTYTVAIDLKNSTTEDDIFAWDAKVEFDASANPAISFRFDSDFNLRPSRCHGNIIRLCYDGIDCTSTDKMITLGHDFTYSIDSENGIYSHDLEGTFTHPAQDKDYSLSFTTSCYRDTDYSSQISVLDHQEVIFDASYAIVPEQQSQNGSIVILLEIPGVYSYESRDTYSFADFPHLWVSSFRSDEKEMSFVYTLRNEGDWQTSGANEMIMKYTDIRGNVYYYWLHNTMTNSYSTSVHQTMLKENGNVKMSYYQSTNQTINENLVHSETIYVVRTAFGPSDEYSCNTTLDIDRTNNNEARSQVQLRFLPNQKPITLTSSFNNATTASKKAGDLTTTLTLEQMSITVFAAGQLEGGVPSGNLSIKFLPLMGQSRAFGVDLVMKNQSTPETSAYETNIVLHAPDHKASLKHNLEYSNEWVIPLSNKLTGSWNEEKVSVDVLLRMTEDMNIESSVRLTMPEHEYVFQQLQSMHDGSLRSFTITKDSQIILRQGYEITMASADAGKTVTFDSQYRLVDNVYGLRLTLANLTTSYSFNIEVQQNDIEQLYADVTLNVQGAARFDVATELRSVYAPGYDTKVDLMFEKGVGSMDISSSVQIDDTEVFSVTLVNGTSGEGPRSRMTRLVVRQPTNADLRLRQAVLEDSCSMTSQLLTHNTTLLWGNLLPTQTIALRIAGSKSEDTVGASVQLLNPGRVLGFGSQYAAAFQRASKAFNRDVMLSFSGEAGNILTVDTEYKNSSQDFTKDHLIEMTFIRGQNEPIVILTTLVFNRSNTVLDADLTVTYNEDHNQKLTTGVEVTRLNSGHSTVLTLQHLVNGLDMTIMGSYRNSSNQFEMTLENSVMIGDERYQPEISCSLNHDTKEIEFTYTGSSTYGFYGQFINRSTEAGPVYELSCSNTYNDRIFPYAIIYDGPDRQFAIKVMYNPDNIQDFWQFSTGYANDTAVYTQLDTMHSGQLIRNASIVLSMMTSPKVMTTHIKWEPTWPADLKAAIQNIVEQIKEKAANQRTVVSERWMTIAEKMAETKTQFLMANMDIVSNAIMLKTQVDAQYALSTVIWQQQKANLKARWNQFAETFATNMAVSLATFNESQHLYMQQYNDIGEYFATGFELYARDGVYRFAQFVEAGAAITTQYDMEVIIAHVTAVEEARNAFYEGLAAQLEQDMAAMKPDHERIAAHFGAITLDLAEVGARISQEFLARISTLESEKSAGQALLSQIMFDAQIFIATWREAVRAWRNSVQTELEPFRHPDFSQYVAIVEELKEFLPQVQVQFKMQMLGVFGQFFAPYASLITQARTRARRQAPEIYRESSASATPSSMDIAAIQRAMARFNAKYSLPSVPAVEDSVQVAVDASSTVAGEKGLASAIAVEYSHARANVTTVLDILKKVLNGTLDVVTFDLENGEILFKIHLKDFSNVSTSSPGNMTRSFLERILPNNFDTTQLEKLISMFEMDSDLITEYGRRFQTQFTANRTRYAEIMRDLQADLRTRVGEALETRVKPYIQSQVRPYIEKLDAEIRTRTKPFFGSVNAMPMPEEYGSFLDELSAQMDFADLQRMAGRTKQAACGLYNKMTSVMAAAKMATCPRRWLPPYKANALIIGASHYMTFDREFYDFAGKCGYVLAKDFVHENDFTAIVDYEREMDMPIRNMMFMINGTLVEIKSDGSVLVNRQPRELPFQVGDTVVVRIGDSIFLKNANGVSYVCKLPHDVCLMTIGGRYFARTAGLLGNFNFEPADDFKTPDNELQTNVTSFAESWKVGKNCERLSDRNRIRPSTDNVVNFDPLHPDNQQCAGMFLDQCSNLAQCHNEVDPDPFYRMCVMDTRSLSEEERSAKMCSIAAAYKSQCWMDGHPVNMPDSCITCENGDETYDASAPIKLEKQDIPRKADVVLVVEEKHCVESIAPRLDDLVDRLAGVLKENGFNDTQFGLVGFGGAGIHDVPHQHTINHKIFNNRSSEFVLGRDSLEFASEDEEGSNDTLAAIRLAANYPFRTGVSKHVIVLMCSECRKQDTHMKFSDLSVMFNKRDISLTLLTDFQFSLKKDVAKSKSQSKSKSERVYGIDATSVYTSKMVGQDSLKGDRALREFINEPSNLCSLLATETDGAIFDASLLGNKGFDEVLVNRVVKSTLEPSDDCQMCRCVADKMVGTGRSVCETCADPMSPLRHLIRGGIRDFELQHNLPHANFNPRQLMEEEE